MRGRLNAAGAAAAGTLLAVLAGCGEPPVSPLPIQTPIAAGITAAPGAPPVAPAGASPTPTVASTVGRPQPASEPKPVTTRRRGTRPPTTAPSTPASSTPTTSVTPSPSDCLGAVPYDVDATGPEAPPPSLCVEPGATLRVSNVGPDEVTAEPADLVTLAYEDGAGTVTFAGAGTVTVGTVWAGEPYVIEVEVRPSSPPDAD